jgi:hypothetical protein
MESMPEVSAAGAGSNESRREALKRFGRYAAAAPSVMVLLQPHESHASRRNGRGRGRGGRWGRGRGRGGGSHY